MSKDKKTLFKKEICILGGAKVILESEDKIDDKFKFFKIIENVSKYYKPI